MAVKSAKNGFALILTMIILVVMSALAGALATVATSNVQIAENNQNAANALSNAHSGLEIMRYTLNGINVATGSQCISTISSGLASSSLNFTSTSATINFSPIAIDNDQSFSASVSQLDSDSIRLTVTGISGSLSKSVSATLNVVSKGNSVFDYGIASKGPLVMTGQAEITGADLEVDSSVYIEGDLLGYSFTITNKASVGGNVHIVDEYASYYIGSKASVGGTTGDDAESHIIQPTDAAEFPTPNPTYFESFATGEVITSQSQIDNYDTFNNAKIAAGTNPIFASNVTINGVLYIETPNIVTFAGKTTVNGIIVGNGTVGEISLLNDLIFAGQVECHDVSVLEGEEFDAIKQETGTFILAPGFNVGFGGQTYIDNGVIAANGIAFTGQAGGNINGSMINYSTGPVVLTGQSSLFFNRSGTEQNPAGFSPVKKLQYLPQSYSEKYI